MSDQELFGPQKLEPIAKGSSFVSFRDLNKTNPFEDFYYLLFQPRKFFNSLGHLEHFKKKLLLKTLIGAALVLLITAQVNSADFALIIEQLLDKHISRGDGALSETFLKLYMALGKSADSGALFWLRVVELIKTSLKFLFLLTPLLMIVFLFAQSYTESLFLKLFGAPAKKVSFRKFLAMHSFLTWLSLPILIPVVGGIWAFYVLILTYQVQREYSGFGHIKFLISGYLLPMFFMSLIATVSIVAFLAAVLAIA